MALLDRLRGRRHAAPAVAPIPPPEHEPDAGPTLYQLVMSHDWAALADRGPAGLEELTGELRRLVALRSDPAVGLRRLDPELTGEWRLILTLVELGGPAVTEAMVASLQELPSTGDTLCTELIEGLARLGTPDAVAALVDLVLHGEASKASYAASMLGSHPCDAALPAVMAHVADPEASTRRAMATILGALGSPDALDTLVAMLEDDSEAVRDAAIAAIGHLRDERGILPLLVAEERERRTTRPRHSTTVALTGAPSPWLLAVDEIVSGDESDAFVARGGMSPFEREARVLERTAVARERCAADVAAATAHLPEPPVLPWTVDALVSLLRRPGVGPHGDHEGWLRYQSEDDFNFDLERCRALGCEVSTPSQGEPWDDPMGGESWWVTAEVACADGAVTLWVVEGSEPAY